MKKIIYYHLVLFSSLTFNAQSKFPSTLLFQNINLKTKTSKVEIYNLITPEKKAFLFYDIKTEPLAEVMYNGTVFVFNNTPISIFPIFLTGQLNKKASENFNSKIETQLYKSLTKTIFNDFKLTEADFPILIVYDEKNELCGFASNTEQIADIDCGGEPIRSKFLRLKILTEEKNNSTNPYAFKPVVILGSDLMDTIAEVKTNQYGDFDALLPNLNQDYIIKVNEKNTDINFVVLSTQSGKKVGNFKSIDGGFEYRILKLDLIKLPDIFVEEDISLKLKNLDKKETNSLVVTENLFYESGDIFLTKGSKEILDKMELVLIKYPYFNIVVTSHTDAKGHDDSNLKLSLKRSQEVIHYLRQKGIAQSRLKAIGKGETQIRNRCKNDTDCSDREHEYNRRTEFLFIKK